MAGDNNISTPKINEFIAYVKKPLPSEITSWANTAGINLVSPTKDSLYELEFKNNILQLNWLGEDKFSPIYAGLPRSSRLISPGLLANAFGKKVSCIADLTAGLGVDSFVLASKGKKVICVERSAPIALLLFDGIRRSPNKISDLMTLCFCDSRDWLSHNRFAIDAVYIDSMFSGKKKTAKSPKSMQILRKIVGDDLDVRELLIQARQLNLNRIVVKSPDGGKPHNGNPIVQFSGNTVRFDVYKPTFSL